MKKALILLLFLTNLTVNAQNFKNQFFKGNWIKQVGCEKLTFPKDTFNVLDNGSQNKGIFYTTPQIQKTINKCAASNGGVVYIPEGKYLTGSLFLKDNVHLLLDEKATLLASMDINDYPEQPTRVAGFEMVWPMAILNVKNAKNVKISGKGMIHGRGKPFWDKFNYMKNNYVENDLRWALDYDCKRPRMMVISNAENVHISQLKFKEAGFWTVHVLYSKKITIDGIIIRNNNQEHGPSTDGVDIDSSSDILVQNCDIDCNDDNFCIKAGRDADGLRVNKPSHHIVIRNNTTRAGAGIITFGSETSGGIHHVYVTNMTGNGTTRGIRFKSARTRGGVIENILIENIDVKNSPFIFEFTMNWNPKYSYTKLPEAFENKNIPQRWKIMLQRVKPPEKGICILRNVMLSDFKVSGKCWKAFRVEGVEEAPIENFVFKNISLHTETGGTIKNAKGWKVINSSFHFDDNKPIELINCSDMDKFFTKKSN